MPTPQEEQERVYGAQRASVAATYDPLASLRTSLGDPSAQLYGTPKDQYAPPSYSVATSAPKRDEISNTIQGVQTDIKTIQEPPKPQKEPPKTGTTEPKLPTSREEFFAQNPDEKARFDRLQRIEQSVLDYTEELNRYNDPQTDPKFATYLSSFNRQFDDLRKETESYNSRIEALQEKFGIMSGTQRYSPYVAGGEVLQRVGEGIKRISDLEAKRRETIASAYEAMRSKRFTEMSNLHNISKDLRESVYKEFERSRKEIDDENKALQEKTKTDLENIELGQKIEKTSIDSVAQIALSYIPQEGFDLTDDVISAGEERFLKLAKDNRVDPERLLNAAMEIYNKPVKRTQAFNIGGRQVLYDMDTGQPISDLGIAGAPKPTVPPTVPTTETITTDKGEQLTYGTPEYVAERLVRSGSSKGKLVASEREQLGKFANVVALTDNLVGSLSKTTNDPILGYLKSLNPYDFDARAVNAQVVALVPSVARALYGEVGVLTDTDIERYLKTLPNIKSTPEQNKFIALMTLANARRAYEQSLLNAANSQVNVSGFVDSYKNLIEKINKLEGELGVGSGGSVETSTGGETTPKDPLGIL